MGVSGFMNFQLMGFEELAKKYGFKNEDLQTKAMKCQAPGGGPTQSPIVLFQALTDQPCEYFVQKSNSAPTPQTSSKPKTITTPGAAKPNAAANPNPGAAQKNAKKWWQFWK
jgi:hypothetical protein